MPIWQFAQSLVMTGQTILQRWLRWPAARPVASSPSPALTVEEAEAGHQGLWGLVVEIDPSYPVPEDRIGQTAPATEAGVQQLLEALDCLQCRAVLLEWARGEGGTPSV